MSADFETIIRYDGPALVGHEMDVQALAPALLALASLIQDANREFNGDKAAVKVVVNADLRQQCFQIKIKFVQDFLQMARTFLDGDMADIKTICEWIGIGSGAGWTLFKIIVAIANKRAASVAFSTETGDDSTVLNINELHIHGDVPEPVKRLLQNSSIVENAQAVFRPVVQPGYETLGFYEPAGREIFSASKEDAEAVLALPPAEFPADPGAAEGDAVHTPIIGRAGIKTQRNEGKAQWELKWAGKPVWASIADTEWLSAFQGGQIPLPVGSWLDITMEMTTSRSNPDAAPSYKVLKVHGVILGVPGGQEGFFDDKPA